LGRRPVRMAGSSGRRWASSLAEKSCADGRATSRTSSSVHAITPPTADFGYAARMRLKIRRLDSTIALPAYGTEESAGFDLAAARDVTVAPRQIALVQTGLVIEVPTGHFLAIVARSSTPLKRGLAVANGVGVIDPDYCGPADEVLIQVLNIT